MSRLLHILVVLLTLWGTSAVAATTSTPTESSRVGVAPVVYIPSTGVSVNVLQAGATIAAEDALREWPDGVVLVDQREMRVRNSRRPAYEKSKELGDKFTQIGIKEYKRLETNEAINSLKQATDIYQGIGLEVEDPKRYANALQYLALAYLERGQVNPVLSLELLKMMVQFDPRRSFERGFYPDHVVEFFESSRRSIEKDLRGNGPDSQMVKRWAEVADVEYLITLNIVPSSDGFELLLRAFDRGAGGYLPVEKVPLKTLTEETVGSASSRAVSRFLTCIQEAPAEQQKPVTASKGDSPWAMDLNFAYASFFVFPESSVAQFGHYGASFGLAYLFTREFSVSGGAQILTSLRDKDGLLVDDITTLRGFAGVGLGYTFGVFRAELGAFMEAATAGDIKVCDDINEVIPGCDSPGSYDLHDSSILVGLNVRPRAILQLLKSLMLTSSVSASFYFFPLSERTLNFPITVELGLQYRF